LRTSDIVNEFARKEIGCAYAWGGTGQPCIPMYRKSLIQQYPGQGADVRRVCQVLSGREMVCAGCKYKGRKVYDCAQLVRRALEKVGAKPPSGATSQWKTSALWSDKGPITEENIEEVRKTPCMLFRQKSDGKTMAHVAINTGTGIIIEAQSVGFGVVSGEFKGPPRFTHYAIPTVYGGEAVRADMPAHQTLPTLKYGNRGEGVREMQEQLVALGFELPKYGVDGKFGAETQRAVLAFRKANYLPEGLTADTEVRTLLRNKTAGDAA
jgi:cell wall-associated NlpC family hydrolase